MSRPLGSTHSATQEPSVSLGTVYKSSTLKSFATFRLPAAGLWARRLELNALPIINQSRITEKPTTQTRTGWSFCMDPRMASADAEGKPAREFTRIRGRLQLPLPQNRRDSIQLLSAEAINAEASGVFLAAQIPAGWRRLPASEASQIYGRGYPNTQDDPDDQPCPDPCSCPPGSGGGNGGSGGSGGGGSGGGGSGGGGSFWSGNKKATGG